jgi:hypothetical protein
MKLYTEEQVRNALWSIEHPFSNGKNVDEIINSLTPIELPTDEEIKNWAKKQSGLDPTGAEEYGRIRGAKWIRDKIQGGNNEQ